MSINLYDRLFRPTIKNGVEMPEGDLVTTYTVSPDGLKYTMQLQKGVKFHDGTESTADDVAWSFDRYLQYGKGFSFLYTGYIDPGMTKALDKYTVEFNLKKPYTALPASLCRFAVLNRKLVEPHINDGPQGHDWLHLNDAGSGPYKLKEWRPREETILVKFDDYWRGWGAGNRVTEFHFMPVIEVATMKTLLLSGKADLDDGWMGTDAYKALEGKGNIVLERHPWIQERVLTMNNQRKPFDDIHVRKAVSWAIDYDKYNTIIEWDGQQAKGPVPIGLWGHNPNVFQYHYDVNKAKEELALSKYSAQELAEPIVVPVHNDKTKLTMLFVSEYLKAIGLNIQIEMTTWTKLIGSFGQGPQAAPPLLWWGNTVKYPSPDAYLYGVFHKSTWGTWSGQAWYDNPEVNALLEQSRAETDTNKLLQLYATIQEKIVADAPMVWLSNPYCVIARQSWVKGFTFRSTLGEYLWIPNFTIEPH